MGTYRTGSKAALMTAIEAAQAVVGETNDEVLNNAETVLDSAMNTFESSLISLESFYSTFINNTADVITLYPSNNLKPGFMPLAAKFMVNDGLDPISSVAFNEPDNSISIHLTAPLSGDIATFQVMIQDNAFQTSQEDFNSGMNNIPVHQASQLDLSGDHLFGVDDLISILTGSSPFKDINLSGYSDNTDIQILLKQISPIYPPT